MQFTYQYVNNIPVINFIREDGSLLGTDLDEFSDEVTSLMKDGVYKLVFDLRKHSYLNSFGLGELINLRNYFLDKGIVITLIINSKKIIKLFDMVGVNDLFEIVDSEKDI